MALIDFHRSGIFHLLWKRKIRAFLDEKESFVKAEFFSARKCELGTWLYAEGLNTYGKIPEIIKLEEVHSEIHIAARKAMGFKESGDMGNAELEYAKLDENSKKLIHLLTSIGMIIN
ncbi:MAG: CZB domain-containing protein [Candidatus Omnitrophota bacterium]